MVTDEVGFFKWVADKAWIVSAALIGLIWKQSEKRLEDHKREASEMFGRHEAELQIQRGHIGKLFENAEADRKAMREMFDRHNARSEDRHIELLTAIHEGLDKKADK